MNKKNIYSTFLIVTVFVSSSFRLANGMLPSIAATADSLTKDQPQVKPVIKQATKLRKSLCDNIEKNLPFAQEDVENCKDIIEKLNTILLHTKPLKEDLVGLFFSCLGACCCRSGLEGASFEDLKNNFGKGKTYFIILNSLLTKLEHPDARADKIVARILKTKSD